MQILNSFDANKYIFVPWCDHISDVINIQNVDSLVKKLIIIAYAYEKEIIQNKQLMINIMVEIACILLS